ncbi:16S rRNA (guanine(527)-N(7))-methyltransferase RsmG [Malaciobacter molluscorum LMG 25693]|uniref:Ribosomal RNA small subunit methyltransferase G n=1 Tax=Malaciobacter molluscorum LMG 25693 TaxID=870501 RepID=A0A2G1DI41_9BACT|nr:16S rRNA (guanine(527)-N(7))-methyltransferase RsmG [Malaciobacter molluscorum]AXX92389.1 16S rRNA m7G527 methyltransferase [Malaciobacter molluscorum LMG 25693]PHO18163.1 16S rRNA (guanine(527)-N(7))-methyltransferase RsmG [Malaciobacter molluscorum LMG 25693]RXJ93952.1 16S rRNA (guanine(527)-N(7))-methyltransferase RsmG [Malaciobacter molluscorum]
MLLKEKLKSENLIIKDGFLQRCDIFIELLQKWGKVHNLSGSLKEEDIYENIIDSIYPLSFIDDFKSFADIGTGAGYPGLILAMAKPEKKCYLIEPRVKRVSFLNFVKNTLGLNNVEILCKRVEEVKDIKVDLITSRAVTNTSLLLNLTKNIIDKECNFLFYKGSMLDNEIEEAKIEKTKIVKRKDRNYLYYKGKQ